MLDTSLKESPKKTVEKEADAELAEVFGGEGVANPEGRAKWYVSGLWPFRRISFECPGCSRWLSAKTAFAGRVGFCPSCDLTVSMPAPEEDIPPALVSQKKEIPAVPARRLPNPRPGSDPEPEAAEEPGGAGANGADLHRLNPERDPEWSRRDSLLDEEEQWGIDEKKGYVPLRVVTKYQTMLPWIGCAALAAAAVSFGYAFMVSQRADHAAEIPSIHGPEGRVPVPLGSELWVVLDSLATATEPEEMVSLVRKPKEILPKMERYYAENPGSLPHRFERAKPGVRVYQLGARQFARFEGRCDGRPVKFSFELTTYGWRLDWESMIGYCEHDWGEYLRTRPEGEFRFRLLANVTIDPELKYDREKYLCLHLTDHLETGHGYALVDRFGAQAAQLDKFLTLHEKARTHVPRTWVTPVLKTVEGSDELLELVALKSASWLLP